MPRRRAGSLLSLEVSILTALRDEPSGESHGFALAQAIADAEESRRLTASGTLYRVLHRLDDAGLVVNWWEDPDEAAAAGRPRRRLYRITGAGAAALARAEADRVSTAQVNPGFAT